MPQANITYDTPYNRALAARVLQGERLTAMRREATEIPMRLGSFHDPHAAPMVGGGRLQEYATNGTSATYPPINMRSGMEVSSGGSHAGVDGAIGGGFWKDFARGFTGVLDLATAPLALVAPPLGVGIGATSNLVKGLAGGASSGGAVSGGGFWSDFGKGFKKGFFGTIKALTSPVEILAPQLKPVLGITNALGKLAGEGMSGGALAPQYRDAYLKSKKISKQVAPLVMDIFGKKSPFLNKAVGFAHEVDKMLPADMRGGVGLPEGGSMVDRLMPLLPFAMKYLRGSGMCRCSDGMYDDGMKRLGMKMRGGFKLSDMVEKGKKAIKIGKKGFSAVKDAVELVKGLKGGATSGGGMVGNKKDACGRSSGTRDYNTLCEAEGAGFFDFLPYSQARKNKRIRELAAKKSGGASSGGAVSGGAKKDGRAIRAAIVKKIMKERGINMISASKAVKAEGLY